MKMVKVTSNGITRLIDAYKLAMNRNDKLTFGCKSESFFENCEISIILSDVKGIELITLRKFCPSMIVIDADNSTFTSFPKPITNVVLRQGATKTPEDEVRESELDKLSEALPSLYNFIINTSGIKKDANDCDRDADFYKLFGMFDIGSYRFKVIARFEGVSILSLLDAFPEYTLFKQRERVFIEEGSKEFENLCGQRFVKNFYNYMEKMLSGIDILSDVRFNDEFLKYVDNKNICSCTHIKNSFTELKMSDYNTHVDLIRDMKTLSTDSKFIGYEVNLDEDMTYHFAISSTIENLLKFLSFSNLVYYYADLKTIVGCNSEFTLPLNISSDMQVVFADAIARLDEWRLAALKQLTLEEKSDIKNKITHYSRLELYNFIPRGAIIKFMVRGTKKDFEKFVDVVNSKPNYLDNDMKTIINIILNQFKLVRTIWDSGI